MPICRSCKEVQFQLVAGLCEQCSILALKERIATLEAQNAKLRDGLKKLHDFVKVTVENLDIVAEETPEESDMRYQILYVQLDEMLKALIGGEK